MDLAKLANSTTSIFAARTVLGYIGCSPAVCPHNYVLASPIAAVDKTDAPLFVANSEHELVPLSQATAMARRLARAHVPHKLYVVPGGRHARGYETTVWKSTMRFLEKYLGRLPIQDLTPPSWAPAGASSPP